MRVRIEVYLERTTGGVASQLQRDDASADRVRLEARDSWRADRPRTADVHWSHG